MKSLLKIVDTEVCNILKKEFYRQKKGIELIASENFAPQSVLSVLGSVFTNKYSEGRPYKRYYGGNEHIDELETLCENRALELFKLNKTEWAVNVQPLSGCAANMAVYTGLLQPHDKIMGLDLPSGGHLSHGFQTKDKKISATSIFFESSSYKINSSGFIDYEALKNKAEEFCPRLIICGGSAYPCDWNYKAFREIADSVGAYLMCDMAHISGLIAAGKHNNPFEYADVVTSTTHKTLKGPRSGMIFIKRKDDMVNKINNAVFPGLQGGPHNNQIGALAVQLKLANTPEFKEYITMVKKNAKTLENTFRRMGYTMSADGTSNHLLLLDLKPQDITGSKLEKVCEAVNISINKNTVIGDNNPMNPGGVRLGTSAMTTRGMGEEDFIQIAHFIHRCVKIAQKIQDIKGRKLVDFCQGLEDNSEIIELRDEVSTFAEKAEFYDEPEIFS
jgi:glycine hydroxymethyltransferase